MAKDLTYFNEGVEAFQKGESYDDPPYHPRDNKCLDWQRGWKREQLKQRDLRYLVNDILDGKLS